MDLKKLTPGEMIIAISGIVLLIFSFFDWYSVDVRIAGQTVVSASENGWGRPDAFFSVVAILIGVVMAAHVLVDRLTGVDMPERLGKVGWGVIYLAGGVVAFLFLLIKYLGNTDFVQFAFYLSIIATIGLAVGGFLVARERGHLAELTNRRGGNVPPATPPAGGPPAA